jgi:hypothetical protein
MQQNPAILNFSFPWFLSSIQFHLFFNLAEYSEFELIIEGVNLQGEDLAEPFICWDWETTVLELWSKPLSMEEYDKSDDIDEGPLATMLLLLLDLLLPNLRLKQNSLLMEHKSKNNHWVFWKVVSINLDITNQAIKIIYGSESRYCRYIPQAKQVNKQTTLVAENHVVWFLSILNKYLV